MLPSYIHCSDSVEKLQELTDDIEDKKANVKDMMDILTEIPEDEIDDLEKELDAAMEKDKKNKKDKMSKEDKKKEDKMDGGIINGSI